MIYLLLPHPGHGRIYDTAAESAALAELRAMIPRAAVCAAEIAGMHWFSLEAEPELSPRELEKLSQSSLYLALFAREGELLRPIPPEEWRYLPDSLNTILKYSGKTNERFTRMLVNLACSCCGNLRPVPTLLDPMCGQGTTLFEAAIRGWNAIGLETKESSAHACGTYFVSFLEKGGYKHRRREEKRTKEGKRIAQLTAIDYASTKEAWRREDFRTLSVFRADSALCAQLLPKNAADLLVCDLPYGVQHGAAGAGGLSRDASALVRSCAAGWKQALRPGAGLALAYNTFTTPRKKLALALEDAGFTVLPPVEGMEHRVDQSILRDVILARRE